MEGLNKILRKEAIANGLCNEWQELWKEDWSQEKLIEMMYKGMDFCLKHHWPSNQFIVENFDVKTLRENGVFVNEKRSTMNPYKSLVLGNSEVKIRYNSDYIGECYVRDKSSVIITAKGRSFVMVHVFDKATVTAGQFDKATIVVIKHSPAVTIFTNENIIVKEEYDYLK